MPPVRIGADYLVETALDPHEAWAAASAGGPLAECARRHPALARALGESTA